MQNIYNVEGKTDIHYNEGSVKVRKQEMIKQLLKKKLKNMVKSYKDDQQAIFSEAISCIPEDITQKLRT